MSQRGLPNTLICTSVTERCLSFGLSGGHVSQTDQCFTFYNTQSDTKNLFSSRLSNFCIFSMDVKKAHHFVKESLHTMVWLHFY